MNCDIIALFHDDPVKGCLASWGWGLLRAAWETLSLLFFHLPDEHAMVRCLDYFLLAFGSACAALLVGTVVKVLLFSTSVLVSGTCCLLLVLAAAIRDCLCATCSLTKSMRTALVRFLATVASGMVEAGLLYWGCLATPQDNKVLIPASLIASWCLTGDPDFASLASATASTFCLRLCPSLLVALLSRHRLVLFAVSSLLVFIRSSDLTFISSSFGILIMRRYPH